MSLIKSTINDVLTKLKAENPKLTIETNQLNVVANYVNDGSYGSFDGERILELSAAVETGITGKIKVGYSRLQLSRLNAYLCGKIRVPEGIASTHAALPYIEGYYRLGITANDIEDVPVYLDEMSKRRFIIRAVADSPCWAGEVDLEAIVVPTSLTSLITSPDLGAYEAQSSAKTYSYPTDFTSAFDTLSLVTTTTQLPLQVMETLRNVTGDNWVSSATPGPFNYYGATIEFAGINSSEHDSNPNYKYLIIAKLSSACTNMSGQLYIHFNDPDTPVDPTVV